MPCGWPTTLPRPNQCGSQARPIPGHTPSPLARLPSQSQPGRLSTRGRILHQQIPRSMRNFTLLLH